MEIRLLIVLAFVLSTIIGRLCIPYVVMISKKKRLFDDVTARKSHNGSISRLGGIIFFPAFLFSITSILGIRLVLGVDTVGIMSVDVFKEFFFLISGTTILYLIGMSDDLDGARYYVKLIVQIIASGLLVLGGLQIVDLSGLFGINGVAPWVGIPLTIILIVLIVNAYNLIDGVDGLCASLSIVSLTTLGFWFFSKNLFSYTIFSMAIVGVLFPFIYYNIRGGRLKIFMGDTGSLTVGFMIAFLALKFYTLNSHYEIPSAPAIFLGVIFVPVFDAVRVFATRMINGHSPVVPDRTHIHHKMLDLQLTHLQATMAVVTIQCIFIIFCYLLRSININILLLLCLLLGAIIITTINLITKNNTHIK